MPSNFQRLKAGQPWRVTQATADAIIESAEQYAQHSHDPVGLPPPEYRFEGEILDVRNDSGAALNRFSVVGLDNALITDDKNLLEFQNFPRFSALTPKWPDHVGRYGVLIEPIAANAIGKCLVSGVVPVQVRLQQKMDNMLHAQIIDGVSGYLQEAEDGLATIVYAGQPDTGGLACASFACPRKKRS